MGCDIHLQIEVRIDGQWHHLANPAVSRNYALFAKMADVRNYDNSIAPISEPKGLPADMTFLTALDVKRWEGDAHSKSWLGPDEIAALSKWLDSFFDEQSLEYDLEHGILHCYLFGNSFAGWKKYPEDNDFNIEDVRFIFWFDN